MSPAESPTIGSDKAVSEQSSLVNPRGLLAEWANTKDEWVRLLIAEVLASGSSVGTSTIEKAYKLFREEKTLDRRALPQVPMLDVEARQDESAPPLFISRLSEVRGVNALAPGAVIEPHEGLTILYGENGTGKTGYSRVFKALANSRTADIILGNVKADTTEAQAAKLEYKLGDDEQKLDWQGDPGVSPFTRMSIFDSSAVSTHVDDDLDYVYTPASLALFNHVSAAIQAVTEQIDATIGALDDGGSSLLSRFQRGSSIYLLIETLGVSTDLTELKMKAATGKSAEADLDELEQAVAVLRANTIGTQITALKAEQRVLTQATTAADVLLSFDGTTYNETLTKRAQLTTDHETFRTELFAAADLPADPDDTWSNFIEAGETYRQHLVELGAHDSDRCLYCRQPLLDSARDLLSRYSTYLQDKISADIRETDAVLAEFKRQVAAVQMDEITRWVTEYENENEQAAYFVQIAGIEKSMRELSSMVVDGEPANLMIGGIVSPLKSDVDAELTAIGAKITALETQQHNRAQSLAEEQAKLVELKDAVELGKSWSLIEAQGKSIKEAAQLQSLRRSMPSLVREITDLAKTASDQMINQSFDTLFLEECEALRAPILKLKFIGREGRAHRRKVLSGKHKPSKVLSEGEQKVLALADFLAEARLSGVTAPIIFDDPVSSLDHRRINEVAQRIARLAEDNQVIVFTHDILFATTLLNLLEKSKRYIYFKIADENGKGQVTRASGPRIDTLSAIKKRIAEAIKVAKSQEGEARDALVREAYSHVRAWCEVFTEEELLKGVTKRYRANVQMTTLPQIDGGKLDEIGPKVTEIFEVACRYIDGHSQPLVTLGVSPTLTGLEQHWAELQDLKKINDGKR